MPKRDSVVQVTMPRPPSNSVQLAIRIPAEWLAEADEIAKLISTPGVDMTRSDAFRAAIARGFAILKAEAKAAKRGRP